MSDHLFPKRITRREFIQTGALAVGGVALSGCSTHKAAASTPPVRVGSGQFTYTLDPDWGALPEGMSYGLGCGIVVDGRDRVYVTTRSADPCVAVFDRRGRLLETWSKDFAHDVGLTPQQVKQTAHCIYWSKEGGREFLYFTENVDKTKDGRKIGARVYKTDLHGKILYTLGNVDKETSTTQPVDWTNPTDVAVAPNGDIYIVDGYGSQRVFRFDRNFKHVRTIGSQTAKDATGPNAPKGTFNTCHGVWVRTRKNGEPEVYIADRNNDRLQVFDLELNYKRTVAGSVRNPCCFYQHGDLLFIPDLASRVTILDTTDNALAQLGNGSGVPNGGMGASAALAAQHPDKFFAPHAMCVDSRGDFYVVEWVSFGRPRKFRHTPQPA